MSVVRSTIDKQTVIVDALALPQGYALASGSGTGGNLPIEKTKLAYNLTDDRLYYCNGTAWKDVSGQDNITLAAVGSTPNANGATLTGQVLNLQPASVTQPGVVSTVAQTFNGVKTFDDGIIITPVVSSGLVNTSTQQYFHNVGAVSFTGAAALNSSLMIQRIDSFAWIAFSVSNSVVGAGGILTMSTTLATEFRPGTAPGRHGYVNVVNNGTPGIGTCLISTAGVITIGKTLGADAVMIPFDAGATQILDCAFTYTLA